MSVNSYMVRVWRATCTARSGGTAQAGKEGEATRRDGRVAAAKVEMFTSPAQRRLGVGPLAVYPADVRGVGPDRRQEIVLEGRRVALEVHALHGEDRETRKRLRFVFRVCRAHRGEQHFEEGRAMARAGPDDPLLLGTPREPPQLSQLRSREKLLNSRFPLERGEL